MIYIYDEILQKMVYTFEPDDKVDTEVATRLAKEFSALAVDTQEYLLTRLAILTEQKQYKDSK